MKNITKGLLGGLASIFLASTGANAGVIDFKANADLDERAISWGTTNVIDGVSMTFYALDVTGGNQVHAWAYLDHGAGLGVCRTLRTPGNVNAYSGSGNECNPGSDDNIQLDEWVGIEFDNGPLTVSNLVLRAEGHGILDGDVTVTINGTDMLASVATAMTWNDLAKIDFTFGGNAPDQYYVSAFTVTDRQVPEPAILGLMGFGLLGVGTVARRRNKQRK